MRKPVSPLASNAEGRTVPVSYGELQKPYLELREGTHITQSMVDASAACRMNPLAALAMDRSSLMRESLRVHGGVVYPGLRALSAEKPREAAGVPMGYDLHYKPDMALESRKPAGSYVSLYKSPSPAPGLQKHLMVPGAGGDALGLDRRMGTTEKQSELGLNGSSAYLRLPWMNPYPDAGMYPFLDSSKYAALNMYKASFLSQPSPYLAQHLPYQPLCGGAGGSAAGTERLFYMPYPPPPAPITSPLAPPLRIPTASVAPTALSPLVHCQDKGLQSIGPRIHHEPSAFGQQLHQPPPQPLHQSHSDRQHGSSSKSSRTASSKSSGSAGGSSASSSTSINGSGSSLPVDSTSSLLMQSSRTPACLPQTPAPPPPPPPLLDSSLDFQKSLLRGPPSSSSSSTSPSVSHPFFMTGVNPDHHSPARPAGHKSKSKEGGLEPWSGSGGERRSSKSPSKTTSEKPAQQGSAKDPADKPLDLSAKITDFGAAPNGIPPKLEAIAKLGNSPTTRYGQLPCRDLLKETLSPSSIVSTSSKPPERPEIISTLHSSWVVPGPGPTHNLDSSQNLGTSVIKNKNLDRALPQQRSSSCPRIGEPNGIPAPTPTPAVVTPAGRPASTSPSPKLNGEWPKPGSTIPEKSPQASQPTSGKLAKIPKRPETQEITYKPPQSHLENGQTPGHLYLPQNDTFLPPSIAYANRYLPYPDGMSLPHIPLPGKGPVYPHPVLLGSGALFPGRVAPPKHGLPYGLPSSHGEFLTYHESQEMVHPLMSPHLGAGLDPKVSERLERRPKTQEKLRLHEDVVAHKSHHSTEPVDGTHNRPNREIEWSAGQGLKPQNKLPAPCGKEKIICIDLIQDDVDGGFQATKLSPPTGKKEEPARPSGEGEPELMQLLLSRQLAESDKQLEPHGKVALQEPDVRRDHASPEHAVMQGAESPACHSPLPDLLEQQTLRCARTSGDRTAGDRTSEQADTRHEFHSFQNHIDPVKDVPEDGESHEEDDDGSHGSSKTRRSSLAKRIANSSGYVGDRFKCVTTELYADSSKLSREQRALQRAMMRFSELELREKEGGGGGPGRELADGQHSRGDWDCSQRSAHPGVTAPPTQAEKDGAWPACVSNRVPVLQRCGVPREAPPPSEREQGRPHQESREGEGQPEGGGAAEGQPPEDVSPGATHARKRTPGLEEGQDVPAKRPRLSTDLWTEGDVTHPSDRLLEEVKNLKVCIELTGLRLSKPRHLVQLRELWGGGGGGGGGGGSPERPEAEPAPAPPPGAYPSEADGDLDLRAGSLEERTAKRRSEVSRSWCDRVLCGSNAKQDLSPAHRDCLDLPPLAPTPARLSDKRQRLKEHRKVSALGPALPDAGRDADPAHRPRRLGESEKPNGKRQCKTKHISLRERRGTSRTAEDCPCPHPDASREQTAALKRTSRKRSASLSDCDSSPVKPRPPSPPPCPAAPLTPLQTPAAPPSPPPGGSPALDTPASRPMPPEARRLIVNKNAGETLLQRAARLGYEEVVLYCLENKVCDVNHRDNAGYCALHEACARGWLSIVQHLVEHGADINCSAQDGTRPLHDAVENDHLDVVRLLLSYGADPTLATYSGRGLLKMTHSELMECFLLDYFSDLQGRADADPRLCWEFYGSSVCEPADDLSAFDVLANPPGPSEGEEEQREVFEFEFSDRPLLPCYNIQVSLSQGPRNWLLLSDVLKRLKMSARAFRAAFTHIEVATIAEAEFYKQASLSQLFSCPDELEGFLPDSKELLDLVEISAELTALLGSSLECLDGSWDPVAMAR
ncbi:BCL-6 corepressor isoform X2 [Anguilla anguilla]|uniref:BCL-6 corepressor isoform X2 n=1 Tax=Anguilla anguilla TaxID=7936 RepID=UPI0015B0C2AE|nr:BCL-6 corepressor isoform X2 [Anguilla anguilla]